MRRMIAMMSTVAVLLACCDEGCPAGASRCDGAVVVQCVDGEWVEQIDCAALADWRCCAVDGGADCFAVCP